MDVPTVIALVFVAALLCGWGIWFLGALVKRRSYVDPYSDARVQGWIKVVERTWETSTLGGFKVWYRLRGLVKCVDREKFAATLMLKEGNELNPLVTFQSLFIQVRLFPFGKWFLRYGWTPIGAPALQVFRFGEGEAAGKEIFDANGSDLRDAANTEAHTRDTPSDQYGCRLDLLHFDKLYNEDMIEENHRMLSDQDRKEGEKFLQYQRFKEASVILALKLQLDLSEKVTEHNGDHLSVIASVVGGKVGLKWQISAAARKDKDRVWGFRGAGSFQDEDPLATGSRPGELIVDADRDGQSIDVPPPGQTYFYTFFLRERQADGSFRHYGLVRFSVPLAATGDIAQLKRLLDESRMAQGSLRGVQDRERERRSRIVDKVNLRVETREVLMELRKRKVAEVQADPTKTDAEKKELVDAIEGEISDASAALSMD